MNGMPGLSEKIQSSQTAPKGTIAALLSFRYRFAIVPLSLPVSLPLSSSRQEALQGPCFQGGVMNRPVDKKAPGSPQKGFLKGRTK